MCYYTLIRPRNRPESVGSTGSIGSGEYNAPLLASCEFCPFTGKNTHVTHAHVLPFGDDFANITRAGSYIRSIHHLPLYCVRFYHSIIDWPIPCQLFPLSTNAKFQTDVNWIPSNTKLFVTNRMRMDNQIKRMKKKMILTQPCEGG